MIRMIIIVGLAIYAFTLYGKLEKANEHIQDQVIMINDREAYIHDLINQGKADKEVKQIMAKGASEDQAKAIIEASHLYGVSAKF